MVRIAVRLLGPLQVRRADGTAVLLVEQNVRAAMKVADRHYIMAKGKIVGKVTSEQLEEDADLRHRYLGVSGAA